MRKLKGNQHIPKKAAVHLEEEDASDNEDQACDDPSRNEGVTEKSKNAVMVVRNSMAYQNTLWKKTPVATTVAAHLVPKPPMEAQLQEGVD